MKLTKKLPTNFLCSFELIKGLGIFDIGTLIVPESYSSIRETFLAIGSSSFRASEITRLIKSYVIFLVPVPI